MKRWFAVSLCIALVVTQLFVCSAALAASDGDLFDPTLTNELRYSLDRWLRSAENRATLTICLCRDYENSNPKGYKLNLDAASFVGESDDMLYVLVKTKTTGKHLLIGYEPDSGLAMADTVELGTNNTSRILAAMEQFFSGNVYTNDENEIANALTDYNRSSAKTSTKTTSSSPTSKSTGKISYYNPNNRNSNSGSSTTTSKPTAAPKASSNYPFKSLTIQFMDYPAVKRYSVDDWYSSSKRRALLTALIETPYDGLRYKDKSMPLPSTLFGTSYVGRSKSGQNTLYYITIETDQPKIQLLFEFNPSKKTAKYAVVEVSNNTSSRLIEELCGKDYHKNNSNDISEQYFEALDMQMKYLDTLLKNY